MRFEFRKYHLNEKSASKSLILSIIMIFWFPFVSFSQTSLLEKIVVLPEQNTNVEEFLEVLGQKAGCSFTYGHDIPISKKVQLDAKKQSVENFLIDIFQGDSLRFIEKSKKIIIIIQHTAISASK